jgi:hypothetical protein
MTDAWSAMGSPGSLINIIAQPASDLRHQQASGKKKSGQRPLL